MSATSQQIMVFARDAEMRERIATLARAWALGVLQRWRLALSEEQRAQLPERLRHALAQQVVSGRVAVDIPALIAHEPGLSAVIASAPSLDAITDEHLGTALRVYATSWLESIASSPALINTYGLVL